MKPEILNFQYECDLDPEIIAGIGRFPWANPGKRGPEAARSNIALHEVRTTFGRELGVASENIHFIGEPAMLPYFAIMGFLSALREQGIDPSKVNLIHSPIDSLEVHAIADSHFFAGGKVTPLPLEGFATLGDFPSCTAKSTSDSEELELDEFMSANLAAHLLFWQVGNLETGGMAPSENFARVSHQVHEYASSTKSSVFTILDATASGAAVRLDRYAQDTLWDCAIFDSRAWGGPQGLGVLVINNENHWINPFPHIDPRKVPGSFSMQLALQSALALEKWSATKESFIEQSQSLTAQLIDEINSLVKATALYKEISFLYGEIPGIISININGIDPLIVADKLAEMGFLVDVGSSCSAALMEPSYILEALNYPNSGVIRINLRHDTTTTHISQFAITLCDILLSLTSHA